MTKSFDYNLNFDWVICFLRYGLPNITPKKINTIAKQIIAFLTKKYWSPGNETKLHFLVETIHSNLANSEIDENGPPFAKILLQELENYQLQFSGCPNNIAWNFEQKTKNVVEEKFYEDYSGLEDLINWILEQDTNNEPSFKEEVEEEEEEFSIDYSGLEDRIDWNLEQNMSKHH